MTHLATLRSVAKKLPARSAADFTLGLEMKINYRRAAVVVLFIAALGGLVWYLATPRRCVLARMTDPHVGQVLVIARSSNLVDGWLITLSWRRQEGRPWMQFYLDHETRLWRSVQIDVPLDGKIAVRARGHLVGELAAPNGSFKHVIRGTVATRPAGIVMSDDPFDLANRISTENTAWNSAWTDALRPTPRE